MLCGLRMQDLWKVTPGIQDQMNGLGSVEELISGGKIIDKFTSLEIQQFGGLQLLQLRFI